jgi:hypothetical protein
MGRVRAAIALSVTLITAAPVAADEPQTARGSWREHRQTVGQAGFSVTYSCEGLARKLELLLRTAGARADAKAIPLSCGDPGRPNPLAQVELRFHTLAPTASPVARPAGWRPIVLAPSSPRELTAGDCELIERFESLVLPSFTTRKRVSRVACVPHQRTSFSLRFEVFGERVSSTAPHGSRA